MINDLILLTTVFVQSWMQLPQCITQVVIYKNYVLKKDAFHDLIKKKNVFHDVNLQTMNWKSYII